MPDPTAEDLLTRGLFHDRIIPPLSSLSLSNVMKDLLKFTRGEMKKKDSKDRMRSRLVRHSVPKLKHLRRHFGVPNPYSQAMLCISIATYWKQLDAICKKSPVSLSRPVASTKRALAAEHSRRVEGVRRAQSSVGKRFMLKADIATFYPSIYTHSISWAIHGKEVARSKRAKKWYGNQVDLWMRETQDRQTGGIPIGPDTSLLIAEVIASRMDSQLSRLLNLELRGVRYIDDYHLYFATRGDAERALAALHTVAQMFELQLNGPKTEILDVPETIEPPWKTDLRLIRIRSDNRATGIKAFFDRASDLATRFPSDSVLTYAVRKITRYADRLKPHEWDVCRSLFLRSCLGEPTMLPALLELFETTPHTWDRDDLQNVLTEICLYHAPLQHGFEVAWSLWVARSLSLGLPESVSASVRKMDDDIVALVALDMEQAGLLPPLNPKLWASRMTRENLYSEHWLLAYEANMQGWLPSLEGVDYIAADPFFSILQKGAVKFYNVDEPWEDGYSDYSDGDDDQDDDNDEELEDDVADDTHVIDGPLPGEPAHFPGAFTKAIEPPPWAKGFKSVRSK
jgi:hypothetical protein